MQKYIAAFDGGGTKTACIIASIAGEICFYEEGDGTNHTSNLTWNFTILDLLNKGLKQNNLIINDICFIYLGLSGADLESDFSKLNQGLREVFPDTPFKVVNDAWIIMRSGLKEAHGAVAICGTGTNAAAQNKMGDRYILRSLGYSLGTYGGGLDIARECLHQAFGYDEGTYSQTLLYDEIPKLFGVNSLAEVVDFFYPKYKANKHVLGSITRLANELAIKGDQASIFAIEKAAKSVAWQTAGVIEKVNMQFEEVNVVVGGGVFKKSKAPVFFDTFKLELRKRVPFAKIIKPLFPPVVGAFYAGLDELKITQTKEIEDNVLNTI